MNLGIIDIKTKEGKFPKNQQKSDKNGLPLPPGGWDGFKSGGSNDNNPHLPFPPPNDRSKLRICITLLIAVVIMTFVGLIGAYVFLSSKSSSSWHTFVMPRQIWFSTAFLLTSSITYYFFKQSFAQGRNEIAKKRLLATAIFGGLFVVSQILVWLELINLGVYLKNNPYAGFFYIISVTHAVHVFIGLTFLFYLIFRIRKKSFSTDEIKNRKFLIQSLGRYWDIAEIRVKIGHSTNQIRCEVIFSYSRKDFAVSTGFVCGQ